MIAPSNNLTSSDEPRDYSDGSPPRSTEETVVHDDHFRSTPFEDPFPEPGVVIDDTDYYGEDHFFGRTRPIGDLFLTHEPSAATAWVDPKQGKE